MILSLGMAAFVFFPCVIFGLLHVLCFFVWLFGVFSRWLRVDSFR